MKSKNWISYCMIGGLSILLAGCGANERVTGWGGESEIYLPDNMKFINYNIQSKNDIWCTYRPMRADEQAEVIIVQQSRTGLNSITGDGRFIVYESKDGVQAELSEEQLETIRGDTTNQEEQKGA